jgi:predicted MFS family arabinose efflux permease
VLTTKGRPSPELAAGVAQAGIGFVLAGLGPCLILLARDLRVPLGALSWLSAGFGLGLLLSGIAGTRLLRLGTRRLLSASATCLAAGAMLLATAAWVQVAKAGALLVGLGGAGLVLACWALLSGPGAAKRLTYANAASSLAGILAPPLMGAVDALTGRGRLGLLLSVPPLLWLAFKSPNAPDPVPGGSPRPPESGAHARPSFWGVAARWTCVVAAVSAEFAFVVWGAARLQASGLSPSAAAACAVAFPVGMGVGRLLAPRMVDRVPVVALGAALGMASALVAAAPAPPLLAVAALGGAGLGIAPLFPLMLARLMGMPGLGARRGASVGTAASGVAVLGAPVLLNLIASHTSLRAGFLVAVAALLVTVLLSFPRAASSVGAKRAG